MARFVAAIQYLVYLVLIKRVKSRLPVYLEYKRWESHFPKLFSCFCSLRHVNNAAIQHNWPTAQPLESFWSQSPSISYSKGTRIFSTVYPWQWHLNCKCTKLKEDFSKINCIAPHSDAKVFAGEEKLKYHHIVDQKQLFIIFMFIII